MLSAALLCIALNVYHEARGEPLEGQVAIAYVTHKRAGGDPSKYCATVRKPGQFSWVPQRPKVDKSSPAWKDAQAVAKTFLLYSDRTRGATYYHERSCSPKWKRHMKRVAVVGKHIFYRKV